MTVIELTQGKYAQVDKEDFEILSQFAWRYDSSNGYAVSGQVGSPKLYLHRFIFMFNNVDIIGLEIDHKNRNRLDCRKINLRLATRSQQTLNSGVRSDNKCGSTGVHFDRTTGKYCASIKVGGTRLWGGRHKRKSDAIKSRDEMKKALVGLI